MAGETVAKNRKFGEGPVLVGMSIEPHWPLAYSPGRDFPAFFPGRLMALNFLSLPDIPPRLRPRLRGPRIPPVLRDLARAFGDSVRDLTPIVSVIAFFQILVLGQAPDDFLTILAGMLCVAAGLTLFVTGLEMALFPLGESMANGFVHKGSLTALIAFAFALGFGTTVAEPALIAVCAEAARAAAVAGVIADDPAAIARYALELRFVVAFAVGIAIVIGVTRILMGWPIHWLIIGGYALVVVMTTLAPREIISIAYDSGAVTTSTITVPMVTALGVGLASSIRGRNPMLDGFGLIAFASLTPMIFVMGYGMATN